MRPLGSFLGLSLVVLGSLAGAAPPSESVPQVAEPADKTAIEMTVTGLRNSSGSVRCTLSKKAQWLKKGVPQRSGGTIKDGKAVCVFDGVAPGLYAISAYHDEDANKVMRTNFLGIPSEGACASNDAKARFGPPTFADASISYRGGVLEVGCKLIY